jgi:hypothetical protein
MAISGRAFVPRLRSVHERPGHATPEYRTLAIPVPADSGAGGHPPQLLSRAIAHFAEQKHPVSLFLAIDVLMDTAAGPPQSAIILEARDVAGTRRYLVRMYEVESRRVRWSNPSAVEWLDAGEQEMILDAAFEGRATPSGA